VGQSLDIVAMTMTRSKIKTSLKEITPVRMRCMIGACPAIFETADGRHVIIGKIVSADDVHFGETLNGRIGPGEIAIEVPSDLIAGTVKTRR
jgi:hypothetical protein